MRRSIAKILFALSKTVIFVKIVGLIFEYATFLLPVSRVIENERIISFQHPQPAYSNHIVIVPKKAIPTFLDLIKENHVERLFHILETAKTIIDDSKEFDHDNWVLCVNGGSRQEVNQVHFHLFTLSKKSQRIWDAYRKIEDGDLEVFYYSTEKQREFIMIPEESISLSMTYNRQQQVILEKMISCFQLLDQEYGFSQIGYSLIFQEIVVEGEKKLSVHIFADSK